MPPQSFRPNGRPILAQAAVVLFAALLAFVLVTLVALEGNEVAVLYTRSAAGEHQTRVWVVDHGGAPWIEAASPERAFYRDILIDPHVELQRNDERVPYHAVSFPGDEGHQLIRGLLRRKYGWADVWVGLIADTSASVALCLEQRSPADGEGRASECKLPGSS